MTVIAYALTSDIIKRDFNIELHSILNPFLIPDLQDIIVTYTGEIFQSLQDYTQQNNLGDIRYYTDKSTDRVLNRPGIHKMISELQKNDVIFTSIFNLSFNIIDMCQFIREVERQGATITVFENGQPRQRLSIDGSLEMYTTTYLMSLEHYIRTLRDYGWSINKPTR